VSDAARLRTAAQALAGRDTGAGRRRRRAILFVIGTLDLGGTESQLVLLARELKRRGWQVEVFALSRGGVLAEQLTQAGIAVFYGHHRPNPAPISKPSTGGSAAPAVRENKRVSLKAMAVMARAEAVLVARMAMTRPTVVHAALPLTNFIGALAGRLAFAPLVITSRRGLGNHQERWPRMKLLDRIANGLSHVVVANSNAVARDTAARDAYDIDRIRVIPNGLDLSRFEAIEPRREESRRSLGLAEGDVAVAIVANLIPYKGHRDLVAALALAIAKRPTLKLFLVGQDRGVAPLVLEDARRLGVESRVAVMGLRNDIPGILAGMDIGVIASHEEGFCNALMEKLAAGLPVVATDVGGNPEAIADMPGCELVRARDPADLARGLLAVVDRMPEPAADREVRRRKVRERYSLATMVDAYEQLYLGRQRV